MLFALLGNQNSGKTTLFNRLTGSNQHVGNFPGVTVEQKSGSLKKQPEITVVDLPGIYSMSPFSAEEIVTRDFVFHNKPDCIINIVDAMNIRRNLYLTLQLLELDIPVVLAVNMMDEFLGNGNKLDCEKLSRGLGVPIVPISAAKNQGIDDLISIAIKLAQNRILPKRLDFCTGPLHRSIHSIAHIVEDHAARASIPLRFAASKLIEGDDPIKERLKLSVNEDEILSHTLLELQDQLDTQIDAAMADMRYGYIENICNNAITTSQTSKEQKRSTKMDDVLTHKYLAIPIFLSFMLIIFYLTFNVIGRFLSDFLMDGISYITAIADSLLTSFELNPVMHSLIIDGVFAGVGSVLSFLPIIVVLFFFLSILEDSGYIARVAFVMDKLLRKIGLSGKSLVPMIIGFGCSVPAIMATRTLGSERDRKMTIFLIPFMSCSAKLPIYALFSVAFFKESAALVMIGLYVFGILMSIGFANILKVTIFKGNSVPFIMEIPPYRFPSIRNVIQLIYQRAKDFVVKAFTIIFVASIIIWFMQNFDLRFNVVANTDASILAQIGKLLAPIFSPLGFNDWRATTAIITGITAKEAVLSTLAVLTNLSIDNLSMGLGEIFSPLSAFSFLIFTSLYTPCVATVAAIKREFSSGLAATFISLFQLTIAYIFALTVYWCCNLVIT